jgi:hypothetical protein
MWCSTCDEEESMCHILTKCRAPTREVPWNLAKSIWPHNENTWPQINLGTTLGCGTLTVESEPPERNQKRKRNAGATRLLQILFVETTYLCWTLRCERVIQGKDHTQQEIERKWLRRINNRLSNDKITAIKIVRKKKYIRLIKDTWGLALKKRDKNLPQDWITRNEVF